MTTKDKWKLAAYITIGLAILGGAGLAWWFGQKILSGLLIALGFGGGKKVLKAFVQADTDKQQRDAVIEEQAEADTQVHQQQTELDNQANTEQKAKDEAETEATLNDATQESIDEAVSKAVEDANSYYDKYGEGGFVRALFCIALIILALCMMAIAAPHAPAAPRPSKARLSQMASLLNVIKRGKREHQALRRRYARDMMLMSAKLRRSHDRRASDQKACTAKIAALNMRRCPPTWPGALISGGTVLLLCGIGIGVREVTR